MENLLLKLNGFLMPKIEKLMNNVITIFFVLFFVLFMTSMLDVSENDTIVKFFAYSPYIILGIISFVLLLKILLTLINKLYDLSKNNEEGQLIVKKFKEPIIDELVKVEKTFTRTEKMKLNNGSSKYKVRYCYVVTFSDGESLEFSDGTSQLKIGDEIYRKKLGLIEVEFKFDNPKYYPVNKHISFNFRSDVDDKVKEMQGRRFTYKEFKEATKVKFLDSINI